MAGRQTLNLIILVRIQVPEPKKGSHLGAAFSLVAESWIEREGGRGNDAEFPRYWVTDPPSGGEGERADGLIERRLAEHSNFQVPEPRKNTRLMRVFFLGCQVLDPSQIKLFHRIKFLFHPSLLFF